MEDGALVMKRLAGLSDSLFSSAQSTEILYSLGDCSSKETHDNTPSFLSFDVLLCKMGRIG